MFAPVIHFIFYFSLLKVVRHFVLGFPANWDEYAAISGIITDSGEFANHPGINI